jgi:hypothetical protein
MRWFLAFSGLIVLTSGAIEIFFILSTPEQTSESTNARSFRRKFTSENYE